MKFAQRHHCPTCGARPNLWGRDCPGCIACKIIYLRTPDGRLSRKFQLALLNKLVETKREEVLAIVRQIDRDNP